MRRVSSQDFRRAVKKAYLQWQEARTAKVKVSNRIARDNAFKVTSHPMSKTLESLERRDEELKWDILSLIGGLLDQFDPQSNRGARQRMNFLLGRRDKRFKRGNITVDLGEKFTQEIAALRKR